MMQTKLPTIPIFVFISLVCFCQTVIAAAINNEIDFEAELEVKVKTYSAYDQKTHINYLLNGDYQKSIDEIIKLSQTKNAVDYFMLGNIFYKTDTALSFEYHQKAYKALPNIPAVQLEMAYQLHRQGDCKQALPLYQQLALKNHINKADFALMAHCFLMLGQYQQAYDHWVKIDYSAHHTDVDFTIFEIFGELSPIVRFSKLMQGIRKGNIDNIGPIFELATHWDKNWWNVKKNADAYQAAMTAILKQWPSSTALGKEMRIMDELSTHTTPEAFRAFLEKQQWVLPSYPLPNNSYIAKVIITEALKTKLISHDDIYKHHLSELLQRIEGDKQDIYALDLLAFTLLRVEQRDKLNDIDKLGWKQYKKVNYAKSFLISFVLKNNAWPEHDSELFTQVINDFPNDSFFKAKHYVAAMQKNKHTLSMLAKLIDAEYHGLRLNKLRYSRDLNNLFHTLNQMLESTQQ